MNSFVDGIFCYNVFKERVGFMWRVVIEYKIKLKYKRVVDVDGSV